MKAQNKKNLIKRSPYHSNKHNMPIFFIHVARLSDKMILTGTLDDESQVGSIKQQVSRFYSQLTHTSSPRISYPIQNGTAHFSISGSVFTVCATDREFQPQLAYEMLDRINQAFNAEYGDSVVAAERPYIFMDFVSTLDAIRSQYVKRVAEGQLGQLKNQLGTVHNSMAQNIKTALVREDLLNEVNDMSEKINSSSGIFANDATKLNRMHCWRTYGRPTVVISIATAVYLLVHFLL